jgi:hypothetical protein
MYLPDVFNPDSRIHQQLLFDLEINFTGDLKA